MPESSERSDTIRVSVVLENTDDEVAARLGLAGATGVRRVETQGLIDTGDSRPAPLCVPKEMVSRLGLRRKDGLWDGERYAGPLTARIGGRCTFGDCIVGPPGSPVRIGTTTLRMLDLVPDPVTGTLRPGPGIRV